MEDERMIQTMFARRVDSLDGQRRHWMERAVTLLHQDGGDTHIFH